jgi:hypothetical protein
MDSSGLVSGQVMGSHVPFGFCNTGQRRANYIYNTIATGNELLKTNSAILSCEVNEICQTG